MINSYNFKSKKCNNALVAAALGPSSLPSRGAHPSSLAYSLGARPPSLPNRSAGPLAWPT